MGRSDDQSCKFSLWAPSNRSSRPIGRRIQTDMMAQGSLHRNPHRVPAREEHRNSTLDEHQIPVRGEHWRTVMGPPRSDTHTSSPCPPIIAAVPETKGHGGLHWRYWVDADSHSLDSHFGSSANEDSTIARENHRRHPRQQGSLITLEKAMRCPFPCQHDPPVMSKLTTGRAVPILTTDAA